MATLHLSLAPFPGSNVADETLNLGNIADDVWREKLALSRYMIVDGRYIGVMEINAGRKLRKKERDELEDRIRQLAKQTPSLDPKVIYVD